MKMYFASDMLGQKFSRKSKVVSKRENEKHKEEVSGIKKPKKRNECPVTRPCLFVTCRHNLYIDIRESGNITFNFYKMPVEMMEYSCALDVSTENPNGLPLGKIGEIMNLTRERVRQIEIEAEEKLKKNLG